MTLNELSLLRLSTQQVATHDKLKPRQIVTWMGAMQAQDYSMARWAVAVRSHGMRQSSIQRSIDDGEIIRTHVLRPTWHFISSADARWMIELTAPHIKSLLKFRQKFLELTPTILKKSLNVLEKALTGRHLTRDELLALLERSKIATHEQRASHILVYAELEMLICSGPLAGGKNTYALFDERIKSGKSLSRDQSLKKLATRYFQSHGPATLTDFTNWSGLPKVDATKALDSISSGLSSQKIDSQTYWFHGAATESKVPVSHVALLPAFDEFILGYKDRSACLQSKYKSAVIGVNGMFWPVIVVNGQVIGLWKRVITKGKVAVELKFFGGKPINKKVNAAIDVCVEEIRTFFENG